MNVCCLDMEGVVVPEIWIAFSDASGIPELRRTTRDEPDYDKLMKWRMGILREHGLGLPQIQEVIATIDPLPGAREFLDELRTLSQVIIISDTWAAGAPGRGEGWGAMPAWPGSTPGSRLGLPSHHTPALKPPETVGTWHPNLRGFL